jgi:acyl-CoA synthetase (AMP-forming)/AMP-acid ligase II
MVVTSVGTDPSVIREALTRPGTMFEIRDEDVRGTLMPVFANRPRSLREILERSARFGDRTYAVDGDVRLTFAGHLAAVDAFARALRDRYGVRERDRVAIFAANRWEWLVSFWAVTAVGAVPCAMNGWWTAAEYEHAAALVEPVLVIGDQPRLERLAGHENGIPALSLDEDLLRPRLDHEGAPPLGNPPLGTAIGTAPGPGSAGNAAGAGSAAEDEPALILFTSGTTGRPKAVTIPHRSAVGFTQVSTFLEAEARVARGLPVPSSGDELPPSDEVVLVTAPLFHTSMLQGAAFMAIVRGSRIVLVRGRFDPERVLQTIEKEKVTMWSALGSAAPRVASSPALGAYDTSSVRSLGVGGAPVSPAVQQRLREAFPSALSLGMGYSSTEGGAVIARIGGAEYAAHPTSTGRVTPTVRVELRDEDGRPVPDGEDGELHVRGPYTMLGYWKDPLASAEVLKDGGWLAVGDVARFSGGLLYINARARDLILVNAENVSPTEVEYVLDEHPDVGEAAVLAVDDEVTGDAVCAVVVPAAGASPTVGELTVWCRDRLAHFKVPTRWYLVPDPLPRTPSGKLVKRALRDWVDAVAAHPEDRESP